MDNSRIIKFRGKRIKDSKWIYGDLIQDKDLDTYCIHYFSKFMNCCGVERVEITEEVNKETIGQLSGIKESKNLCIEYIKKEIYEDDIVCTDGWQEEGNRNFDVVEFSDGTFISNNKFGTSPNLGNKLWPVVMGNIHDNLEIMDQ